MLANILLGKFSKRVGGGWLRTLSIWLIFAIILYMFIYLFMAMRSFYRQGWWKTLLKYVLLGSLALILNGLLLLLFFLISAISI